MTFFVTTPIFYVNDVPHIGHAYTTVVADVLARYHRLWGEPVFFLTGTDEHGQKVQNAARSRDKSPQAHVDELVLRFQEVWNELNIQNDLFIRTTEERHKNVVEYFLQTLYASGDIYLHEYEGWYSVSEEIFYTDKDLVDGKSPEGKEVTKVVESNYFFKMSSYQQRLIDHIEAHPDFVQPAGKRSEVLGFLRQPLNDLCISRPINRLSWGIPLPFDKEYVTYVWFDALINYISGVGFKQSDEFEKQYQFFWPAVVHLIGKDILVPHTIYWPTMLMAMGLPLPKTIFAHGWWLTNSNSKMSKSVGEVVRPLDMKNLVGVDAFRYFLCRDIVLGNDAQFAPELLISRVNSELANNLGNLLARVTSLVVKYYEGKIALAEQPSQETAELAAFALRVVRGVRSKVGAFELSEALGEIVELLNRTNRFLDAAAPWKVAKTDSAAARDSLYSALEILRIVGILLSPVMPSKMNLLLTEIGWNKRPTYEDAERWGGLQEGMQIVKSAGLFPRIEVT